ncbi:MAG: hypothetical protein EXQ91_07350, partial [Alphaproteobacteria bacterium]|nr:hypothetical protein [Alphaproteobacteria bacterium]
MELGTAILLSAVFLGMVALFIATKDRWNWKKLFLWPFTILLELSVIGVVGYLVLLYWEDLPRKELGLWGIRLGASFADVKFAKGEPSRELAADPSAVKRLIDVPGMGN